ncbi:MAG: class V aminotransferase, partial [Bacteroidota bacterium]
MSFSRALRAAPGRLHFAAHSHHLWPDASYDGHLAYWTDAAALADRKWSKVFGEVLPEAGSHIARLLGLPDPGTIAFAPNTHDFIVRLFSCLPTDRPVRVLTTSGEFYSFERQLKRFEESGRVEATRIPVEPYATLPSRLEQASSNGGFDLL